MGPPLRSVFAAVVLVVALPHIKAWVTGQWHCHRLIPLSVTSVATPCTFPCLLLSSHYGQHSIIVRHEADGTPCRVKKSPLGEYQESKCRNGVCQLLDSRLHLKRMKRETIHSRKRRSSGSMRRIEASGKEENKQDSSKKRRRKRKRKRKRRKQLA
uniref:Putative conserved secreted protein n=1 Tax=Rhipicephalus microplus TaxID=6941 RepID=A0A6G5A2B0_RHIMP